MSTKPIQLIAALAFLVTFPKLIAQEQKPEEMKFMEKQLVYKTIDGIQLHVDLFIPEETDKEKLRPAIAFFHGGGWVYGSPSSFHEACRRFARKGYVAAAFQYRLSINEDKSYPHPEISPVESTKDARSAMRWFKKNADNFMVNPEEIIVAGHSVGGQLSLSTALCNTVNESSDDLSISPKPAALIIYSGTVNTIEAWCDNLLGNRHNEIWSISPFHNLKSGMPPTLGFHGREDCTVPIYSVFFFINKAKKLGNDIEYVILDGKKHHLEETNKKYNGLFGEDILEQTDEFLEKHELIPD